MREITEVIQCLLEEVIPKSETIVRSRLIEIGRAAEFHPPEIQRGDWGDLAEALQPLGDPFGTPWKERLLAIVSAQEAIPAKYKRCQL
jgi:hypothetical protein